MAAAKIVPSRVSYIGTDCSTYIAVGADNKPVVVFVRDTTIGEGKDRRRVEQQNGVLVVVDDHGRRDWDKPNAFTPIRLENGTHGWWEVDGSHKVFSAEKPTVADRPVSTKTKSAPEKGTKKRPAPQVEGVADRLIAEFDVVSGPGNAIVFMNRRSPRVFATPSFGAPRGLPRLLAQKLKVPNREAVIAELQRHAIADVPSVEFHQGTVGDEVRRVKSEWHRFTPGRSRAICARADAALADLSQADPNRQLTDMGLGFSQGRWVKVIGFLTPGATAFVPVGGRPFRALVMCPQGETVSVIAVIQRENGVAILGCRVHHAQGGDGIITPHTEKARHYIYDFETQQVLDLQGV